MKISSQTVKTDADQWRRLPSPGTNIIRNDVSEDRNRAVPHSLIKKTYARLNDIYAQDLIASWVEEAEPAKHVFEDLAIAAFIIELWRSLYGTAPKSEMSENSCPAGFPGFVDMACGNGVLVYVLLMEGYSGLGFDARRRNSWKTFPESVQDRLMEKIFIPKPFIDVLEPEEIGVDAELGNYPKGTFLISNHADELTVWTPLIAVLACPTSPLPFLAIPCCSHSLSGDKFRYPPSETGTQPLDQGDNSFQKKASIDQNPQPASGDLRALRLLKQKEKTEEGMFTSMYGSLTAKTMEIAQEVGYEVQRSKLQIPTNEELQEKTMQIIRRECENDGGIEVAARKWVERARNVHRGDEEGNTAH
ncbi:unnamed protein product [Penicillium pancosmium]